MRTTELDQALGELQDKASEIFSIVYAPPLEGRFREWHEAMNQLRVDVLSNPWEEKLKGASATGYQIQQVINEELRDVWLGLLVWHRHRGPEEIKSLHEKVDRAQKRLASIENTLSTPPIDRSEFESIHEKHIWTDDLEHIQLSTVGCDQAVESIERIRSRSRTGH